MFLIDTGSELRIALDTFGGVVGAGGVTKVELQSATSYVSTIGVTK